MLALPRKPQLCWPLPSAISSRLPPCPRSGRSTGARSWSSGPAIQPMLRESSLRAPSVVRARPRAKQSWIGYSSGTWQTILSTYISVLGTADSARPQSRTQRQSTSMHIGSGGGSSRGNPGCGTVSSSRLRRQVCFLRVPETPQHRPPRSSCARRSSTYEKSFTRRHLEGGCSMLWTGGGRK